MHTQSRIPKLHDTTFDGALLWFSEMQCSKLLFHPEDDPAELSASQAVNVSFSDDRGKELRFLLNELEEGIGHEKVIEAAYPIFMNASAYQLDA